MKISLRNIKIFLLIVPFIEPLLFKESGYESIDKIYTILKLCSFAIITKDYVIYTIKENDYKISKLSLIVILLELLIGVSTLISKGDIISYFGPAISTVALVLCTEVYFKKAKIDYVKIIFYILFILMIINTILLIKYPQGILTREAGSTVNFLGIDNRLIFFYLPLIYFANMCNSKNVGGFKVLIYLSIGVSLATIIYLWSVGALLGLIILSMANVLQDKFKVLTEIKMKYLIFIIIAINILIVFFQVQNYFEDFIVNDLKKDITFTGRTLIWDNALELVKEKPIIGYGIQNSKFFERYYYGVGHTHNMFLNYLMISGSVGITLYLIIIFKVGKMSDRIKSNRVRFLSNMTIFVILFLSIGDTLDSSIFFLVYSCIYHYSEVIENDNRKKENRNFNIP